MKFRQEAPYTWDEVQLLGETLARIVFNIRSITSDNGERPIDKLIKASEAVQLAAFTCKLVADWWQETLIETEDNN